MSKKRKNWKNRKKLKKVEKILHLFFIKYHIWIVPFYTGIKAYWGGGTTAIFFLIHYFEVGVNIHMENFNIHTLWITRRKWSTKKKRNELTFNFIIYLVRLTIEIIWFQEAAAIGSEQPGTRYAVRIAHSDCLQQPLSFICYCRLATTVILITQKN